MRKLLMLIATLIMCNAYGATENIAFLSDDGAGGLYQYATQSCTTNGNITTPAAPQKTGFRFVGWRNATTLSEFLVPNGTSRTPTTGNSSSVWSATLFYGGTISGSSQCSANVAKLSDYNNRRDSLSGSGEYCWCKMTNAGNLGSYVVSMKWVGAYNFNTVSGTCSVNCSEICSRIAFNTYKQRLALFGLDVD